VLDPTWNPEVANQVKQSGKSIALSDPEEWSKGNGDSEHPIVLDWLDLFG
jgi:hypothetical protein